MTRWHDASPEDKGYPTWDPWEWQDRPDDYRPPYHDDQPLHWTIRVLVFLILFGWPFILIATLNWVGVV